MVHLINRIMIFFILSILLVFNTTIELATIPILLALVAICVAELCDNIKIHIIIYIIFLLLGCLYQQFIYFLPLVLYDLLLTRYQYFVFTVIIPIANNYSKIAAYVYAILLVTVVIEFILKYSTINIKNQTNIFRSQRDELVELSLSLENKITELSDKQDEEISVATLNERNRIAREIHDNVGHLLSSSLLQIGAIIATTKDENTKKGLLVVRQTLDEGMNSIRNSVHNLRDNSVDLYMQLKAIINDFKFCEAKLNYEADMELCIKAKYAIISIVKEALNNIIKHSNATNVIVSLYEHPKIIQLIIQDNGTNKTDINTTGMGIEGIKQRVQNLNGIINISNSDGFKIFISFNKEDIDENSNC